jgi:hypothetical protein
MFNSRFDKLLPDEFSEYLKKLPTQAEVSLSVGTWWFFTCEAIKEALRCMHCELQKKG